MPRKLRYRYSERLGACALAEATRGQVPFFTWPPAKLLHHLSRAAPPPCIPATKVGSLMPRRNQPKSSQRKKFGGRRRHKSYPQPSAFSTSHPSEKAVSEADESSKAS